ncbi:hypothetical protein GCM10023196_098820 [Actinoallomurus vinaceus]|uniref:TetR family transcriptional regulator n=1 Tax=Actinoallomurus vinaceus TaxID=1080074 RepID=A0ABP8UUR3_9ACTN
MTRSPRDREAERTAIRAAADRLLAGTPLRSASGKLTVSELITESGIRRDVIYADHKDLVEEFQARVKARRNVPTAMQDLAEQNTTLKTELAAARKELDAERCASATLRKVIAELSLELQQTTDELAAASGVSRIPRTGRRH